LPVRRKFGITRGAAGKLRGVGRQHETARQRMMRKASPVKEKNKKEQHRRTQEGELARRGPIVTAGTRESTSCKR